MNHTKEVARCQEDMLLPVVAEKGGYLLLDPRAIVEKRLELLAEQ